MAVRQGRMISAALHRASAAYRCSTDVWRTLSCVAHVQLSRERIRLLCNMRDRPVLTGSTMVPHKTAATRPQQHDGSDKVTARHTGKERQDEHAEAFRPALTRVRDVDRRRVFPERLRHRRQLLCTPACGEGQRAPTRALTRALAQCCRASRAGAYR